MKEKMDNPDFLNKTLEELQQLLEREGSLASRAVEPDSAVYKKLAETRDAIFSLIRKIRSEGRGNFSAKVADRENFVPKKEEDNRKRLNRNSQANPYARIEMYRNDSVIRLYS